MKLKKEVNKYVDVDISKSISIENNRIVTEDLFLESSLYGSGHHGELT